MQSWRAFCFTVHMLALGLWLGSLVMVGAAAAVLFPTVRDLNPSLPGFAAYPQDHWLIVAGHVGQKLFLVSDIIQFACSLLAAVTFVALILMPPRPPAKPGLVLRALIIAAALACAAGQILVLAPAMNAAAQSFWNAAKAGDLATAIKHKDAFDSMHPIASRLLSGTVAGVFMSLVGSAWAWGAGATGQTQPRSTITPSRFEEPALLRTGR